jgi:hypothetical protein
MSTARRAYDILRGYVSHGWDQFRGDPEEDAERELREAVEQPYPSERRNAPEPQEQRPVTAVSVDTARRLLDVGPDATSRQIEAAHEKLRRAADPGRFPVGSDARMRADHLTRLIDASKRILCENLDPTIKRFEGLEIE